MTGFGVQQVFSVDTSTPSATGGQAGINEHGFGPKIGRRTLILAVDGECGSWGEVSHGQNSEVETLNLSDAFFCL